MLCYNKRPRKMIPERARQVLISIAWCVWRTDTKEKHPFRLLVRATYHLVIKINFELIKISHCQLFVAFILRILYEEWKSADNNARQVLCFPAEVFSVKLITNSGKTIKYTYLLCTLRNNRIAMAEKIYLRA